VEVQTGQVTTATRDAVLNGVAVQEGQIIGIHDGRLSLAGETVAQVVEALLRQMQVENLEIITLYYGADVSEEEAEALAAGVQEEYPEQEFEVVEGGQPHYFYIISAE
jgi:dihydroxyacetone kinase-like predicted kinase